MRHFQEMRLSVGSVAGVAVVCLAFAFIVYVVLAYWLEKSHTVSCFDEGIERNVEVTLTSRISTTSPSAIVGVTAAIKNHGPTLVRDGVLYIQVTKEKSPGDPERAIDAFVATTSIDVPAEGIAAASFDWRVPADAVSARYSLQGVIAYPNRPYIDISTSTTPNGLSLYIESNAKGSVYIDPDDITVDGSHYRNSVSVELPRGDNRLAVKLRAFNTTAVPYDGTLHWEEYAPTFSPLWVPIPLPATTVKIHPHSSTTIEYVLPALANAPYYAHALLRDANGPQGEVQFQFTHLNSCK